VINADTNTANPVQGVSADVAVIGDGPAGSALASALQRLGVDVVLIGPDEAWSATYTTWADDIEDLDLLAGMDPWAHRFDDIAVQFGRRRQIERAYGVIDNEALRSHLRDGVRHMSGTVGDLDDIEALAIDATGWPPRFAEAGGVPVRIAWQTAFGVILDGPPSGPLGEPTMMDFSDPGATVADRPSVPTFAYSLPVAGGWLVEETVLTADPAIEPAALRPVLAARLGLSVDEMLARSIATETVAIPMGAPVPARDGPGPVRFGAAAGMIHPATGYSIGSALRSAGIVASEIRAQLDRSAASGCVGALDTPSIQSVVWSDAARRTRHLHDYGHDVLLRLDREGVQRFFDTFFDLPIETWPQYLRIDARPSRLAGVMARMFARAPWRLRARLVTGDLRRFIRMLRP
jgi:lycopene beta-cyclase